MRMPVREMKEKIMPVISMFCGVIIRMFFKDNQKHHMPHIHAEYQVVLPLSASLTGMCWTVHFHRTS
jgi:hypothetical protein